MYKAEAEIGVEKSWIMSYNEERQVSACRSITRKERAAVQQNQQQRRFSDAPQQQPVYRFPQNQPGQGWQPQPRFPHEDPVPQHKLSRRDKRALDRAHKRKRKIFTLWNLFAVIGIVTVIIQAARYLVIPLLVYLNVLVGGA